MMSTSSLEKPASAASSCDRPSVRNVVLALLLITIATTTMPAPSAIVPALLRASSSSSWRSSSSPPSPLEDVEVIWEAEDPPADCCTRDLQEYFPRGAGGRGSKKKQASKSVRCVYGETPQETMKVKWRGGAAVPPRPLRIGFLTYATGPYNSFAEDLCRDLDRFAFSSSVHEIHMLLFTDKAMDDSFLGGASKCSKKNGGRINVHKRQQERLGWPFDSVGRHFLYLSHMDWVRAVGLDYVFSIDVDTAVIDYLDERMLGDTVATIQSWWYGVRPERNEGFDARMSMMGIPYSSAYIKRGDPKAACYFAGGLFGGSPDGFEGILRDTTALALADLNKVPQRVAVWHDESYINAVLALAPPEVVLGPGYIYPEPPGDSVLYQKQKGSWVSPSTGLARFSAKILNLGLRKYWTGQIHNYQPSVGWIPAIMSKTGKKELFRLPASDTAVNERVVILLVAGWEAALLSTASAAAGGGVDGKASDAADCIAYQLLSMMPNYGGADVLVLDDAQGTLEAALKQKHLPISSQPERTRFLPMKSANSLGEGINISTTPLIFVLSTGFETNPELRIPLLMDAVEVGKLDAAGGCGGPEEGGDSGEAGGRLFGGYGGELCGRSAPMPTSVENVYDDLWVACFAVKRLHSTYLVRTEALLEVLRHGKAGEWPAAGKAWLKDGFAGGVAAAAAANDGDGKVGLCHGLWANPVDAAGAAACPAGV